VSTQLWAQALSALGKPYDWGNAPVWKSEWSSGAIDRTEVLDDDLSIRLRKTKPEFFALFIERHKVLRFATDQDIVDHASMLLPESFDPSYDDMYVAWDDREGPSRPRWLNTRLDFFVARIIRPDGTWEELQVKATVEEEKLMTLRTYETVWSYVLDAQGISAGDVVEFRWKYMVPYDFNWRQARGWRGLEWMDNWARLTSWRVFFHGNLPVRKQRVEILYHVLHGLWLGGAKPDQCIEEGRNTRCIWYNSDLQGCIDEVGARPANDLPHIVVQLVPEDFRYWRYDRLTGLPFPQPYWLQVIRMREARAMWWTRIGRKSLPDKQTTLMKEFIRREGGSDTSISMRMKRLHDHIAREFAYEKDELWYLDLDMSLQQLGEQVDEKRIRDISRYDLYSRLLNTMELDHVTSYMLDKRVGQLNDGYLTSLWDSEFLFGIRNGTDILWMHPKRRRVGLMADELPFYWQGTSALLSRLDILVDDVPGPPLFVELPTDHPASNVRGIEYEINVDLDRSTVAGSAKVFLSGQFSTLGRAAYQDEPIDSTVDPLYGWRPTDAYGVTSHGWEGSELSTTPPYRYRTVAHISLDGSIVQGADSTYTIDLAALIAHVVPSGFHAADRALPFYWDFPQLDRFNITLWFDKDVEVLNTSDLEVQVSSGNASLERRVQERTARMFQFESELFVTAEKEGPANFQGLEHLLDAAAPERLVVRLKKLVAEP
jgi:hypothetical protein